MTTHMELNNFFKNLQYFYVRVWKPLPDIVSGCIKCGDWPGFQRFGRAPAVSGLWFFLVGKSSFHSLFTLEPQIFLQRLNVATKGLILVSLFYTRQVMKL
jgi:hypothetical protein